MTNALTNEKIIDAMHSSIEGFAFLVVDSLEFELGRKLTDAEQQDVYKLAAATVRGECQAVAEPVAYQSKWIGDGVWRSCSKSRYEQLLGISTYEVRKLYPDMQPLNDAESFPMEKGS